MHSSRENFDNAAGRITECTASENLGIAAGPFCAACGAPEGAAKKSTTAPEDHEAVAESSTPADTPGKGHRDSAGGQTIGERSLRLMYCSKSVTWDRPSSFCDWSCCKVKHTKGAQVRR